MVPIWRVYQSGETIALNVIDLGTSETAVITIRGHRVAVVDSDPPIAMFLVVCETGTLSQAVLEATLVERLDFGLTAYLSGLYRSGLLALSVCPTALSTGDTS